MLKYYLNTKNIPWLFLNELIFNRILLTEKIFIKYFCKAMISYDNKIILVYSVDILTLNVLSQDPVDSAVPSGETCKHDKRFSCP